MSRLYLVSAGVLLLPVAVALAGCGKPPPAPQAAPQATPEEPAANGHEGHTDHSTGENEGSRAAAPHDHSAHEHADHGHADPGHGGHDHADHEHGDQAQHGSGDAGVADALAELTPEDRSLAEKQRICPVSGELLGSLGTPLKVEVLGQQVFLCCEDCKAKLLEKPDEYLTKLKQ